MLVVTGKPVRDAGERRGTVGRQAPWAWEGLGPGLLARARLRVRAPGERPDLYRGDDVVGSVVEAASIGSNKNGRN